VTVVGPGEDRVKMMAGPVSINNSVISPAGQAQYTGVYGKGEEGRERERESELKKTCFFHTPPQPSIADSLMMHRHTHSLTKSLIL
jgi:hypothetical protein